MKTRKAVAKSESLWTKAPVANLIRYEPSGIYFARAKVRGKLVRKSLDTNVLSVAKQRLGDVLDAEHRATGPKTAKVVGKMTFAAALEIFQQRQKCNPELKPRSVQYNERAAECLLRTWPELVDMDVRKIKKDECMAWRARFGQQYAATVVNGTLSILRRVIDIAVEAGVRYDNPAKAKEVRRARVRQKELRLPEPDQFLALVATVRGNGSGRGGHSADAIEFFSYCGPRVSEAARILGRDCDFARGEIIIRGDPDTGTKNWEMRRVPMIPEMRQLLERLKAERGEAEFLQKPVCHVRKFKRALQNACRKLGLFRLTHHDLRHLFATRCIESGVDIPTVAKWLGHKDGGVLAMKTYGHLRDKHSADMAQKVSFNSGCSEPGNPPILHEPDKTLAATDVPRHTKLDIAKAKAKYKYPWWASTDPGEVFFGQVHEPVTIVPDEKFHGCASEAMGRSVLAHELTDKEGLALEYTVRIGEKAAAQLRSKMLALMPDEGN